MLTAILKAPRTVATTNDSKRRTYKCIAVAMAMLIAAVMLMTGCRQRPVMAHADFVHLPTNGWLQSAPVTLAPVYDDSAATYNLVLAVRHGNSYKYRNLSLVVDMIAADSVVNRQVLDMQLADEYGNWSGSGFGAVYTDTVHIASGINPSDAKSVIVWQAMQGCDTLRGVTDMGLITRPL